MFREVVSPDLVILRNLELIRKGYLLGNPSASKVTGLLYYLLPVAHERTKYTPGSDQQSILDKCLISDGGKRRCCFRTACKPGCFLWSTLENCCIEDVTGLIHALCFQNPLVDLLSMNLCKSFFELADAACLLKLYHRVAGFC